MSQIAQDQFTRVFENAGGALGGLKRYAEAANLVGGTGFYMFVHLDEFEFFTDPVEQFKKVKNLLRGIAYPGADDLLRIEITEVTPGATYTLDIVTAFGGAVVASASGTYGDEETLTPAVALGPAGKIVVEAPSSPPGATAEIEIRVVPSAARLSMDVTGETEEEALLEAAAVESHQVTAANFRELLLSAARNRVLLERFLQKLVGKFIGSDTTAAFTETLLQNADGSVDSSVAGLLPELETYMAANTPEQTVRSVDATLDSSDFVTRFSTEEGTLTITPLHPSAGALILTCTRGFTTEIDDPEEFSVQFNSETFGRKLLASVSARPFRQFNWLSGGFRFTIDRKTETNDAYARITGATLTNARPSRIPLQYLTVETFKDESAIQNSTFTITEPQSGNTIYSRTFDPGEDPLPDGHYDIVLTNSIKLSFDWANNPSALGTVTFSVTIHPYRVGDKFIRRYSVENGRLQIEFRRQFNFAFLQASATPTIPDSVVPPDLPYVIPYLGA